MDIWGDLPESQISARQILTAIADLIQAHNDDLDAHLEAGQSLQSHKASDIIDHLARSVVRDKLDFDRFTIDVHFDTIDAWNKSANVWLNAISEMEIFTTSVSNDQQYAYIAPGDSQQDAGNFTQNPTWQTRVLVPNATSQLIYIQQGDISNPDGFGFKILNGTMYAFWVTDDNVEHTYSLGAFSTSAYMLLRCECVNGDTIKFYINDVLVYTLAFPVLMSTFVIMHYRVKTTTTAVRRIYVQNLHWDADYSN
jgi:hypothetical protein